MKISSEEAFLILHKWQVDLTPVVFVGSLMPSNPVRGLVAVVTREGVWSGCDKPDSIWGFLLTGKETSFLASKFEGFEYLEPAELPSDIKMSLPKLAVQRGVLALLKRATVVNTAARSEADRLASVEETLFLVEDDTLHLAQMPIS
jgi:hypothetical protein